MNLQEPRIIFSIRFRVIQQWKSDICDIQWFYCFGVGWRWWLDLEIFIYTFMYLLFGKFSKKKEGSLMSFRVNGQLRRIRMIFFFSKLFLFWLLNSMITCMLERLFFAKTKIITPIFFLKQDWAINKWTWTGDGSTNC